MRRLLLLSAAAAIAVTALASTSPAEAGFHLIRWEGTGFCQIWDESIPTAPYPVELHRGQRIPADVLGCAGGQGQHAARGPLLALIQHGSIGGEGGHAREWRRAHFFSRTVISGNGALLTAA